MSDKITTKGVKDIADKELAQSFAIAGANIIRSYSQLLKKAKSNCKKDTSELDKAKIFWLLFMQAQADFIRTWNEVFGILKEDVSMAAKREMMEDMTVKTLHNAKKTK
jgi:hypothetical protein